MKKMFLLGFLGMALNLKAEPEKQKKVELTPLESIAIGSAAGLTEVLFPGQPLTYCMNIAILKKTKGLEKPVTFNARHMYRGFFANAGGMAPTTALQTVVRMEGEKLLRSGSSEELSAFQKLALAFTAGVTSAAAATPSESIPVYQQLAGTQGVAKSTSQAFNELKGKAWRGFFPTAFRDGLFTVGYGALAPLAGKAFEEQVGESTVAKLAAGAATGTVIALATQPCAVIKTALQGDPLRQKYQGSFDAASSLYRTEGMRGLFSGLSARCARITFAIPLLSMAVESYSSFFTQE